MATMNISLPAAMKAWVERRTGTGAYSNVSDFIRDLIRKEQERTARIALMQRHIDEAYAGGFVDATMDDIRKEALEQIARDGATGEVAAE